MAKMGKRRAAAEQAGTFVEGGSDAGGFLSPHSKSVNTTVVNGKTMTTPYPVKQTNAPVTNPAFIAASKSAVSTNVSPGPQVQGVKPSYSVTPGGPYTGGSLKI